MNFEVLDWVLIGLLTIAVVFLVLFLCFLISFFLTNRRLKKLRHKRPKNKKRRKKWARAVKQLEVQRSRRVKWMIFLLIFGVSSGAAGFYVKYYQTTNLVEKDQEVLVQGYFLVDKIEEQLSGAAEAESAQKVRGTVYDLSARLASYGASVPDNRLSKEGKLLLKRLYQSMKELGLNLTGINENSIKDSAIIESYLADVEKVRENQKQVFKYFRIDESSLKQDT